MVYINELVNGQHIQETYLVRKITVGKTKAGKDYWSVTLGDSTGSIDAKIWSPGDPNIAEFNELDYVDISANVQEYRGELQLIVSSVRKADPSEVDPADFMPSTQKSCPSSTTRRFPRSSASTLRPRASTTASWAASLSTPFP